MDMHRVPVTVSSRLRERPVEYIYAPTDSLEPNYSLGVCTRTQAISRVLRDFVSNLPPGSEPSARHSFAVHRSDCAAVQEALEEGLPCGAEQDAFCWEGTALIEGDALPVPR